MQAGLSGVVIELLAWIASMIAPAEVGPRHRLGRADFAFRPRVTYGSG